MHNAHIVQYLSLATEQVGSFFEIQSLNLWFSLFYAPVYATDSIAEPLFMKKGTLSKNILMLSKNESKGQNVFWKTAQGHGMKLCW